MKVKRIVSNIATTDMTKAGVFYETIFGLDIIILNALISSAWALVSYLFTYAIITPGFKSLGTLHSRAVQETGDDATSK